MKELLLKVKSYIEDTEVRIAGEWGSFETLEELVDKGMMPGIYWEILKIINSDRTLEIDISLKGIQQVLEKYLFYVPRLKVGDTFNFKHHLTDGSGLVLSYKIDREEA